MAKPIPESANSADCRHPGRHFTPDLENRQAFNETTEQVDTFAPL
jgi:hypothetical protein